MTAAPANADLPATTDDYIALDERHGAHNYHPLPVVVAEASGSWVTDVDGRHYLDFLAGYSALNFGHRHPELVAAATEQLGRVTLTSRAFHNDQFGLFCRELAELTGTEQVLAMNSGAEAVESAIKIARQWAHRIRGVPAEQAEIIVAGSNFHGRTTTLVSFSTDPDAHDGFGPFTPGFSITEYGDADAVQRAFTERTAAVLVEPVQGEAGVVVPPADYLPQLRRLCDERGALLIADEIQSGLGRTGELLATAHDGVRADLYTLGKALGGGILPVSAVVGDREVIGVLRPGEHGSTFGGNPLACAVGRAVVRQLRSGEHQKRSRELGAHLHERLATLLGRGAVALRGRGLWAGLDLAPDGPSGREVCEQLARRGVLCKHTQERTLRIAPPLTISREDLDTGLDAIAEVLG
jgi:ornithine--oxo-acid transaminase